MKTRKLSKLLQKTVIAMCLSPITISYAAQQQLIWGKADHYAPLLKTYTLDNSASTSNNLRYPSNLNTQKNPLKTLKFVKAQVDETQTSHVRYQQYYHNLLVWGGEISYHLSATKNMVTGELVTGIQQDVANLNGKISLEQAKKIALENNIVNTPINIQKIIFFDKKDSNKAQLAYYVTYLNQTKSGPELPSYIIDANTGKILHQWDALAHGDGHGGILRLYEYDFFYPAGGRGLFGGIPTNFDIAGCDQTTEFSEIITLNNTPVKGLQFSLPVSKKDEITYKLSPFKFTCYYPSYENKDDGGYAPVNGGVSPMNDAAYFASETNEMWTDQYKIPSLKGIRIFTHVGQLDDSFACGPTCFKTAGVEGNPQIVLGNGDAIYFPLTSADIVAHELGHLLLDENSEVAVSYEGAPISESFADMTGIALKNYLSKNGYAWYWSGDWTIGDKVTKDRKPIRYLDDPKKDGYSIDNLNNYYPSLPAHYASGVYNKAFYLLSTTKDWSIDKAYEVVLGAMKYWTMYTLLDTGSCGIIQSAIDKGYSQYDVMAAFEKVGVKCPTNLSDTQKS